MSDEREAELRALEEELRRPYIEKPDEINTDLGGQCFLDRNRFCGPDCTAFADPQGPTAADRCQLLGGVQTALELLTHFGSHLVQLSRKPAPAPAPVPAPLWKGGER